MERLKRILHGLLFPPVWLAALVMYPGFGWVIYNLATGQTDTWQAYVSYGLSAYSLALLCVRIPGVVRAFRTGFDAHPGVKRVVNAQGVQHYRSDAAYRAQLGLYMGLGVNFLNAAFHMVMGLAGQSLWFGALAGYYGLLTIMRAELSWYAWKRGVGNNLLEEWKRYLVCGAALVLMNQALGVVVALVVHRSSGFTYPGFMVYVMAMYAFYAVISAVVNIVKTRRQTSPVLAASRVVNLVAAMVSILSLETAMLSQFGQDSGPLFRRIMTGLTGGAVCALVLAAAVYMLVKATRQIRIIKQGESQ